MKKFIQGLSRITVTTCKNLSQKGKLQCICGFSYVCYVLRFIFDAKFRKTCLVRASSAGLDKLDKIFAVINFILLACLAVCLPILVWQLKPFLETEPKMYYAVWLALNRDNSLELLFHVFWGTIVLIYFLFRRHDASYDVWKEVVRRHYKKIFVFAPDTVDALDGEFLSSSSTELRENLLEIRKPFHAPILIVVFTSLIMYLGFVLFSNRVHAQSLRLQTLFSRTAILFALTKRFPFIVRGYVAHASLGSWAYAALFDLS
jgi:hypothetical protein